MRCSICVLVLVLSALASCLCDNDEIRTNKISNGKNVVRFVKDFMKVQQQKQDENNLDSLVVPTLDSDEIESKFKEFIEQHKYHIYSRVSPREYELRKAIFARNLIKIGLLNHLEQGTAVYDINEFADLNDREFIQSKLGYKQSMKKDSLMSKLSDNEVDFETLWNELLKEEGKSELELIRSVPESFDWRKKEGAVSSVKNQGNLLSWLFIDFIDFISYRHYILIIFNNLFTVCFQLPITNPINNIVP